MRKENIVQKLQQIKSLAELCIGELSSKEGLKKKQVKGLLTAEPTGAARINFDMSARAFVRKYGERMSYPQKFTLLIAFLSKGKLSVEISLKNIEKLWKRMTSKDLLKGKFNRSYSTKAKTQGWIREGKKAGFYRLDPSWTNIFKSK